MVLKVESIGENVERREMPKNVSRRSQVKIIGFLGLILRVLHRSLISAANLLGEESEQENRSSTVPPSMYRSQFVFFDSWLGCLCVGSPHPKWVQRDPESTVTPAWHNRTTPESAPAVSSLKTGIPSNPRRPPSFETETILTTIPYARLLSVMQSSPSLTGSNNFFSVSALQQQQQPHNPCYTDVVRALDQHQQRPLLSRLAVILLASIMPRRPRSSSPTDDSVSSQVTWASTSSLSLMSSSERSSSSSSSSQRRKSHNLRNYLFVFVILWCSSLQVILFTWNQIPFAVLPGAGFLPGMLQNGTWRRKAEG